MFTRRALIALCLFAFGCGGSGSTSPSATTPQPTTLTLSGRVLDADTNRGVAGATGTILDGKNANATTATDATGPFHLAGMTPGGFTISVRATEYDSAFQGVTLTADTSDTVPMKAANKTLAGTWAGSLSFTEAGIGRQDLALPQVTMAQDGNTVSAKFGSSGPYQASFTGTLRDPSPIGPTTALTGTMTVVEDISGRPPKTCTGTAEFTG